MGRVFYSFEAYEKALDLEIAAAMNDPASRVQVNAKSVIIKNAEERVYNSYPNPGIEWSRRYGAGGSILNPESYNPRSSLSARQWTKQINISVTGATPSGKGFTTYIRGEGEWQQRFGGRASDNPNTLVDAIEDNGIYHAPPRKYMAAAEDEYGSKYFAKDLVLELEENGF